MDAKELIKESVSILDVAALYVNLKPAGKYFKALCPFHHEKTPSFFVMPDKSTFTCYGCNRYGDVFTLVQDMENVDFVGAMNFLAERFHIPLEKANKRGPKKDDYFALNEEALRFFRQNLLDAKEGRAAMDYLRRRGLQPKTIETFALGYAPPRWDGLLLHLQQGGFDLGKALELGLVIKKDDHHYDRFRGRIIFPIFSESGRLLAFGGRTIMAEETAKYLNSPDTPIYNKGEHLYGFHVAKEFIRSEKAAVLVEGYLDLITLHQAGVNFAVASLGTALTEKQIYMLKRFGEEIYICYDNDEAGRNASLRAVERMFEQNINPRIITISAGKDPDDFLRQRGKTAFDECLASAHDGFRFALERISADFDLSRPEKKRIALDAVIALLQKFGDDLVRHEYAERAADFFRVEPALLEPLFNASRPAYIAQAPTEITPAEVIFIRTILDYPQLIAEVQEFFRDDVYQVLSAHNLIRAVFASYDQYGEIDFPDIARRLDENERTAFHRLFVEQAGDTVIRSRSEAEQKAAASINVFHEKVNRKRLREINREIQVAEQENDPQRIQQLMHLKNEFIKSRTRTKAEVSIEKDGAI